MQALSVRSHRMFTEHLLPARQAWTLEMQQETDKILSWGANVLVQREITNINKEWRRRWAGQQPGVRVKIVPSLCVRVTEADKSLCCAFPRFPWFACITGVPWFLLHHTISAFIFTGTMPRVMSTFPVCKRTPIMLDQYPPSTITSS